MDVTSTLVWYIKLHPNNIYSRSHLCFLLTIYDVTRGRRETDELFLIYHIEQEQTFIREKLPM